MKHLVTMMLGIAVIAVAVMPLLSQTPPAQKPAFEVASIKPGTPGPGSAIDLKNGRFLASNVTIRLLLRYAFERHLPEDEMPRAEILFSSTSGIRVTGGPGWINNERFDVEAKPASGKTISQAEMQLMMQSLLEDRFQLKAHRETREVPTYDLVVVKAGKLRPSVEGSSPIPGIPPQPRGMLRVFTIGRPTSAAALVETMYGSGVSISNLAMQLESWAGRPVTDRTNLTGVFDIHLEFSPAASRPTTDSASDPPGASIFTAIQQELGLKLESAKGPVEVLVIDSVSKPSEN